jgi:tetratricopeptide (TPR) repeat protein
MMRDQPRSYRTQWLYAIQLWRANRIDEAAARFELAYRIYDRDSQLLTEYANLMMARGTFDEALPMLERAQQMNPGIGRNTTTLMHAYLAVARYEDAIRTAEFSRRMGGNPAMTLPVRAFAHQQLGDFPGAVAAWRVAITHSTPSAWRLHGFLARARAAAGLHHAALAGLDSARAALPDSADAVLDSVDRAVRDGCYRRAAAEFVAPAPATEPLGRDCDDLGHWFEYIVDAQNANVSQNAILTGSTATARGRDDLP